MSNNKAVVAFADMVLQHFPPFRWEEHQEKAWAETMVRELGGFSEAVIARASQEIIRTRKKPQTPLVSECIESCVSAKRWMDANANKGRLPIDGGGSSANLDWTADRLKLASELVNTHLGRQAAKEGWVGALWSFARKNSRLPQQGKEVDECKRDASGFDEAYSLCVREMKPNDPKKAYLTPVMTALEKIGADMLRRRHVIEKRLLRGTQ